MAGAKATMQAGCRLVNPPSPGAAGISSDDGPGADRVPSSRKIDMGIDADLLAKLACPQCRGPVELKKDESSLVCQSCRLAYKIEDDIPNMLIDDANPWDGEQGSNS